MFHLILCDTFSQMTLIMKPLVASLMLFLISATSLMAAPMTKLRIEVKKASTQKPVEQASVVVRFVKGRSTAKLGAKVRTSYNLKTGIDGVASIPSIPQGKILIQVIAKGHQTFGGEFDVAEEEKTIEIKLNDPQAQFSAHQ